VFGTLLGPEATPVRVGFSGPGLSLIHTVVCVVRAGGSLGECLVGV